ncbi:MAG: T9SS type A sorting domain-containing protein [Flavobacteriaceae bacterium]|nr:T9SS type A sorting domain-containing protein [Flavobacteriaceae bacterium]
MRKQLERILLYVGLSVIFIAATIDLDNLFNYANQEIPDYINKDNTADNEIDDKAATLGRVLFYDKNLSIDGAVACASCHLQSHAFGDPNVQSLGVNGLTPRHSMRLVNARFSDEESFFWDERAVTLEEQTTQPIQDPVEMGFSGTNGNPSFGDLITHLNTLDYYQTLFEFAFGDDEITETRMQLALAQFIRSIQSFDSRFDEGLNQVTYANEPFPNFTIQENKGKDLFLNVGCADCHILSEFALHFNSLNNGVITVAGMPGEVDISVVRAPSLRDLTKRDGSLNGPFMHDGSFATLMDVVNHYNDIPNNPENTNLDTRLIDPNGEPQQLNLTEDQKQSLVAFLKTLGGTDVYTNEKWSNPFDEDGSIEIIGGVLSISEESMAPEISIFPNPTQGVAKIETNFDSFKLSVFSSSGKRLFSKENRIRTSIDLTTYATGLYFVKVTTENGHAFLKRLVRK